MNIPLQRVQDFVTQARKLRNLQRTYRRTVDPILRREMENAESQFDADAGYLAAELAELIAEVEAVAAMEGGAR